MNVNSKASGAPRRVWRMTAENPLGEILELVPKESAHRDKRSPHAGTWEKVAVVTSTGELDPVRPPAPEPDAALRAVARREAPVYVASWRASSWDLLTGLSVCDLSEKMPPRMFKALFTDDGAGQVPARRRPR